MLRNGLPTSRLVGRTRLFLSGSTVWRSIRSVKKYWYFFVCLLTLIAVGDKGGRIGFWSLPSSIESDSLPTLEDGKKDISEVGTTWQFKISNEYCSQDIDH